MGIEEDTAAWKAVERKLVMTRVYVRRVKLRGEA
jgi:hypothetical protein